MSWNKPYSKKPQSAASPRDILLILAALAAIVALSVLLLHSGDSAPAPAPSAPASAGSVPLALPVPPRAAAKPEASPVPKGGVPVPVEVTTRPPQRIGELRDGYVLLPSGELHKVHGIITNGLEATSVVDKTFRHFSDRMLGYLVMAEPGEGMLGRSEELYADFDKEFVNADEIECNEDDTDLQRDLKSAVGDLRRELKTRMDEGEDVGRIMIETRNQLMELAAYRDELESVVLGMTEGAQDDSDYRRLVDEANKMLEERGSKPLELPETLKHALLLRKFIKDTETEENK